MPLNRQFHEITFPANTVFLRDREIKDSRNVPRKCLRNLSPAKIKENKVCQGTSVIQKIMKNTVDVITLSKTSNEH